MASNPYVNKVIYGSSTLIDISDTTAVASDVTLGKVFYRSDGTPTIGTAIGAGSGGVHQDADGYLVLDDDPPPRSAITVTESQDTNGGTIKNIVAVDISNDTVDAAHLLSGYTAHDASGQAITGSYSPPWTVNEVTLTADTATVNELLAILASNLNLYGRLVFWIKTINTNEVQGRVMGGYAYKAGASTFTGGFMKYQTGWSGVSGGTSALIAKTGDVFCWIEGLPGWK